MNRSLLSVIVLLSFTSSAMAEDAEAVRFGLQSSLNNYKVDDPLGSTAQGSGLSFSGIALMTMGREDRLIINLNRDVYNLAASTTNIGQDVSSYGGSLSYQSLLRLSRTWKPWVGLGLGYSSVTYKNRYKLTPTGLYSTPLGGRSTTDLALLFNANSEWQLNKDWDVGLQLQFSKSINTKANALRLGVYFVY